MATVKTKTGDDYGVTMGTWEASLFGCFNHCIPNCCMVWCLPCVSLAQISARLGVYKYGFVLVTTIFLYAVTVGIQLSLYFNSQRSASADSWGDSFGPSYSSEYIGLFEAVSGAFTLAYCVFVWILRFETRTRFEIPGNPLKDCVAAWCCPCCSIAQMATQTKSYKPGSCDFGPRDTLPAYK